MRAVVKHIVARTYKPLLEKYLSKTRIYRYSDIKLTIPPQVFHPGFFSSTQLLLQYIKKIPLQEKRFLELGAGSGLISIYAAKKNAIVTATDINSVATETMISNCRVNKVDVEVLSSDLFDSIPAKNFDIIAINPPYYKGQPKTPYEYAWHCGENGEFFSGLFRQLAGYIHINTEILMVLSDGCDIEMIKTFAADNGFCLHLLLTKSTILENNFIYSIKQER
jgi:release factor glutamine methyltransferase